MPSFDVGKKDNFENLPIKSNEKNSVMKRQSIKNKGEEYDDNFDDGISDNDIIINEVNLNKRQTTDNDKNIVKPIDKINLSRKKKRSLGKVNDENEGFKDKVINLNEHGNRPEDRNNLNYENPSVAKKNQEENKVHDKNDSTNIALYVICGIIILIIAAIIYLVCYMLCRKKVNLKKKSKKKKKKCAKNAREEGAANRQKIKPEIVKGGEKIKKNNVHGVKDRKQKKVDDDYKIPLYTAIPSEINMEKVCLPNNPPIDNSQLQNNIINEQFIVNETPDISLNDNNNQNIPQQAYNIENYDSLFNNKICYCDMNCKTKTTLYTQRGNETEWKMIKEENVCDDFSFQISSSNDSVSKTL